MPPSCGRSHESSASEVVALATILADTKANRKPHGQDGLQALQAPIASRSFTPSSSGKLRICAKPEPELTRYPATNANPLATPIQPLAS